MALVYSTTHPTNTTVSVSGNAPVVLIQSRHESDRKHLARPPVLRPPPEASSLPRQRNGAGNRKEKTQRKGEKHIQSRNCELLPNFFPLQPGAVGSQVPWSVWWKLLQWDLGIRYHTRISHVQGLQLSQERIPAPQGCSVLIILLIQVPVWPTRHLGESLLLSQLHTKRLPVPSLPTWQLL